MVGMILLREPMLQSNSKNNKRKIVDGEAFNGQITQFLYTADALLAHTVGGKGFPPIRPAQSLLRLFPRFNCSLRLQRLQFYGQVWLDLKVTRVSNYPVLLLVYYKRFKALALPRFTDGAP